MQFTNIQYRFQASDVTVFQARAGTIHDSKNRELIQNPDFRDFQVNRESTIRQNELILSIKESILELIQNPDFQVNRELTICKYY